MTKQSKEQESRWTVAALAPAGLRATSGPDRPDTLWMFSLVFKNIQNWLQVRYSHGNLYSERECIASNIALPVCRI